MWMESRKMLSPWVHVVLWLWTMSHFSLSRRVGIHVVDEIRPLTLHLKNKIQVRFNRYKVLINIQQVCSGTSLVTRLNLVSSCRERHVPVLRLIFSPFSISYPSPESDIYRPEIGSFYRFDKFWQVVYFCGQAGLVGFRW